MSREYSFVVDTESHVDRADVVGVGVVSEHNCHLILGLPIDDQQYSGVVDAVAFRIDCHIGDIQVGRLGLLVGSDVCVGQLSAELGQ